MLVHSSSTIHIVVNQTGVNLLYFTGGVIIAYKILGIKPKECSFYKGEL